MYSCLEIVRENFKTGIIRNVFMSWDCKGKFQNWNHNVTIIEFFMQWVFASESGLQFWNHESISLARQAFDIFLWCHVSKWCVWVIGVVMWMMAHIDITAPRYHPL
jgi:hypothetical protein